VAFCSASGILLEILQVKPVPTGKLLARPKIKKILVLLVAIWRKSSDEGLELFFLNFYFVT